MKNRIRASSIMITLSFFLLAGCESLGLPDIFAEDAVPEEVKERPRAVLAPPVFAEQQSWPRLGDVPARPKDFSSKEVYTKSMDELERERAEAEAAKSKVLGNGSKPIDAAPQDPTLEAPKFNRKK